MASKLHVDDRRADLRVPDELNCFFDVRGSQDAGTCCVQLIVEFECDERLILHDEHRAPQQRIDASHNITPAPLKEISVGLE